MAMPDRQDRIVPPLQLGLNGVNYEAEGQQAHFFFRTWKDVPVEVISDIERRAWHAPWLQKPLDKIELIANNFPTTNIIRINSAGVAEGISSANQVDWSGNEDDLGTWNDYNGGQVKDG